MRGGGIKCADVMIKGFPSSSDVIPEVELSSWAFELPRRLASLHDRWLFWLLQIAKMAFKGGLLCASGSESSTNVAQCRCDQEPLIVLHTYNYISCGLKLQGDGLQHLNDSRLTASRSCLFLHSSISQQGGTVACTVTGRCCSEGRGWVAEQWAEVGRSSTSSSDAPICIFGSSYNLGFGQESQLDFSERIVRLCLRFSVFHFTDAKPNQTLKSPMWAITYWMWARLYNCAHDLNSYVARHKMSMHLSSLP